MTGWRRLILLHSVKLGPDQGHIINLSGSGRVSRVAPGKLPLQHAHALLEMNCAWSWLLFHLFYNIFTALFFTMIFLKTAARHRACCRQWYTAAFRRVGHPRPSGHLRPSIGPHAAWLSEPYAPPPVLNSYLKADASVLTSNDPGDRRETAAEN